MPSIESTLADALGGLEAAYRKEGATYFPVKIFPFTVLKSDLPIGELTLFEYEDAFADWLGVLLPLLSWRASKKKPLILYSSVLPPSEFTTRLLLAEARLERRQLNQGLLHPRGWERLTAACVKLNKWPVDYLSEDPADWREAYPAGLAKDAILLLHTDIPADAHRLLSSIATYRNTVILVRPRCPGAPYVNAASVMQLRHELASPETARITLYDRTALRAKTYDLRYDLGLQEFD